MAISELIVKDSSGNAGSAGSPHRDMASRTPLKLDGIFRDISEAGYQLIGHVQIDTTQDEKSVDHLPRNSRCCCGVVPAGGSQ